MKNKNHPWCTTKIGISCLFFLLFINDLTKSITQSSVHFADDTYLLLVDKSLKKINKFLNHDLKHLCQWIQSI